MDDIDRKLLVIITQNPRLHFQELAGKLGISRQAVHHRLQHMTTAGIIKGTFASVSIAYSDAIPVCVWGKSKADSIDEMLDTLGANDLVRRVVVAGGNYVYVIGLLRKISELDSFAEYVKRTAEMSKPDVGIYCLEDGLMPYPVDGSARREQGYKPLTPLDLRIIASLRDDARKPIAKVAESVGASTKTVRRRLESMVSEGSIEFHAPEDLTTGGDLLLIMHLELENGADRRVVGRRLLSKDYFLDQYMRTFSNYPGLLVWVFWSDDINQVRRALRVAELEEGVRSVVLNFAYLERVYHSTWVDELADSSSGKQRRASAKS